MRFFDEMRREYEDRKKSLENFFTDSDINKSVIDDVTYQDDMKIPVKGKELIKKLLEQKGITVASLVHCIKDIQFIAQSIGVAPEESVKEGKVKIYSYKQRFGEAMAQVHPIAEENANTIGISVTEKMNEYNNKAYKIAGFQRDIASVNTMIASIKEDKDYRLPVYIATQLGF